MAFELSDLKGFLFLVLFTIPLTLSTNIDCNSKSFHCLNSTHFMICVDLGGGITSTIDDFIISCPPTTVCHKSNRYECEFPKVEERFTPTLQTATPLNTKDINVLPPLIYSITTTLPIEINSKMTLTSLENNKSKNSGTSDNLKKETTDEKAMVFESISTTPINTISYNTDDLNNTNLNDFIPVTDKIYTIESATKKYTTLFAAQETDQDKIMNTTTSVDSFGESNLNINIVKENYGNQFTTQINELRKKDLSIKTSYVNSNKTADLDQPDNIIVNYQSKPIASFSNNFMVPNIVTDTIVTDRSKLNKIDETLQNLKKEFTDDGEIVCKANCTTIAYSKDDLMATNFNDKILNPKTDKIYRAEATIETPIVRYTMEVPIEVVTSTTLLERIKPNQIETLEKLKEEYIDDKEIAFKATDLTTMNTRSYSIDDLIATKINNKKLNSTTDNNYKAQSINETPVTLYTIEVSEAIATNTTVSEKSRSNIEKLEKLQEEFTYDKEMVFKAISTIAMNTISYSTDYSRATNVNEKLLNPTKDKIYSTQSTTEAPIIHDAVGVPIETVTNIILLERNKSNQMETFEKLKEEYIDDKEKAFKATDNITINTKSYSKDDLIATKINNEKINTTTDNIYRAQSVNETPITLYTLEVRDAIAMDKTTPEKNKSNIEKLENLKEEFTGDKEIVFKATSTIAMNTISYSTDYSIATNVNDKKLNPTTDKIYSTQSRTETPIIRYTMGVPIEAVTNKALLERNKPNQIETLDKLKEEYIDDKEIAFKATDNTTMNTISYSKDDLIATKINNKKLNSTTDNIYKAQSMNETPVTLYTIEVPNAIATDTTVPEEIKSNIKKMDKSKEEFTDNIEIVFKGTSIITMSTISNSTDDLIATNINDKILNPTTDKIYSTQYTTETPVVNNTVGVPIEIITITTVSERNKSNQIETLEKLKAEFTDDKELVFKTTSTIAMSTIRNSTDDLIATNINDKKLNSFTDNIYRAQFLTETPVVHNTVGVPIEIVTNAPVLASNKSNQIEALEKLKEEYTDNKEIAFKAIDTTNLNTKSYNTDHLITTSVNNEKKNPATDSIYQNTTPETPVVLYTAERSVEMLPNISLLESNRLNQVEQLEKLKKEYTDDKDTMFKAIDNININTLSYSTDDLIATNVNDKKINSTTTQTNKVQFPTEMPDILHTTEILKSIVTDTIVLEKNQTKEIKKPEILKEEFTDIKETAFKATGITIINGISYNTNDLIASNIINEKNNPVTNNINRTETTSETPVVLYTTEVPIEIVTDRMVLERNQSNKIEQSEKLKKKFTDDKEIASKATDSIAMHTISYSTDHLIATNINDKKINPAIDKIYSTESTTESFVILYKMEVPMGSPKIIDTTILVDGYFNSNSKVNRDKNDTNNGFIRSNYDFTKPNSDKPIYNTTDINGMPVTTFNNDLTKFNMITDTTVLEDNTLTKNKRLEKLKAESINDKEIEFKTTPINRDSNDIIVINTNANHINPVTRNIYSSVFATEKPILHTMQVPTDPLKSSQSTILVDGLFGKDYENEFTTTTAKITKKVIPIESTIVYVNTDKTTKLDYPLNNTTDNKTKTPELSNHTILDMINETYQQSLQKNAVPNQLFENKTKQENFTIINNIHGIDTNIENYTTPTVKPLTTSEFKSDILSWKDSNVIAFQTTESNKLVHITRSHELHPESTSQISILYKNNYTNLSLRDLFSANKVTTAGNFSTRQVENNNKYVIQNLPTSEIEHKVFMTATESINKKYQIAEKMKSPPEYVYAVKNNTKESIGKKKTVVTETRKPYVPAIINAETNYGNHNNSATVINIKRATDSFKNKNTITMRNSGLHATNEQKNNIGKNVNKEMDVPITGLPRNDIVENSTVLNNIAFKHSDKTVFKNTLISLFSTTETSVAKIITDKDSIQLNFSATISNPALTSKGTIITTNKEESSNINKFANLHLKSPTPTKDLLLNITSTSMGNLGSTPESIYSLTKMSNLKKALIKQNVTIASDFWKIKPVEDETDLSDFQTTVEPHLDSLVINNNIKSILSSTTPYTFIGPVTESSNTVEILNPKVMKPQNESRAADTNFSEKHIPLVTQEINKSHSNFIKKPSLTFGSISHPHQNVTSESKASNISYIPTNQMNYKLKSSISNVKETKKVILANSAFDCRNHTRGKYADSKDCRKFYICIGNLQQIVGTCPNNTVFSEINKQCTRNLSHCVRNNQFHCVYEGRFIDFFNDNIYYICVKHDLHFLRYKLQCQSGYHINKVSVKCEKEIEISQSESLSENSKINNDQSGFQRKSDESKISENKNEFQCVKVGKFPYAKDCRKYYVCSKNKKGEYRRKIKKCSTDEVYDKDKKKCEVTDSIES